MKQILVIQDPTLDLVTPLGGLILTLVSVLPQLVVLMLVVAQSLLYLTQPLLHPL